MCFCSQIYFQISLVWVIKSKLHLFSILYFFCTLYWKFVPFLYLCKYFVEWWMSWIKLGSVIVLPLLLNLPDGHGAPERNNLLTYCVSFDFAEQKNPYQMMTKEGRCSAQPGLVVFAMGCSEVCHQFCILPSLLLTPSNTSKAEEKRKERRKSGIDEPTQAVIELGRWELCGKKSTLSRSCRWCAR